MAKTAFEQYFVSAMAQESFARDFERHGQKIVGIDFFCYNTQLLNPTVAVQQTIVQTQADSHFICTGISGGARTAAGAADNDPQVFLNIRDLSNGKTWFNALQPLRMVSGDAGFPVILPVPRNIQPNTSVQFSINTNGVVAYNRVWISLSGARIFYEDK